MKKALLFLSLIISVTLYTTKADALISDLVYGATLGTVDLYGPLSYGYGYGPYYGYYGYGSPYGGYGDPYYGDVWY